MTPLYIFDNTHIEGEPKNKQQICVHIFAKYWTIFEIFENLYFTGSVVTPLRFRGTNLPQNALVTQFWKSVNIWRRYGQKFCGSLFQPTQYMNIEQLRVTCVELGSEGRLGGFFFVVCLSTSSFSRRRRTSSGKLNRYLLYARLYSWLR